LLPVLRPAGTADRDGFPGNLSATAAGSEPKHHIFSSSGGSSIPVMPCSNLGKFELPRSAAISDAGMDRQGGCSRHRSWPYPATIKTAAQNATPDRGPTAPLCSNSATCPVMDTLSSHSDDHPSPVPNGSAVAVTPLQSAQKLARLPCQLSQKRSHCECRVAHPVGVAVTDSSGSRPSEERRWSRWLRKRLVKSAGSPH
jgi:hypothetical protein